MTASASDCTNADPPYIHFTPAITDWTQLQLPLPDYLHQQSLHFGSPTFQVCEYLTSATQVIPFFDVDKWVDCEPTPSEADELQSRCQEEVHSMFHADPNFDYDKQVYMAQRHGYVPKKGQWKLSFRMYVRGYSIRMGDIPALIEQTASDPTLFDTSPYTSRRLMSIPGACKGQGDERVLRPVPNSPPDFNKMTCIQLLLGGEIVLQDFEQSPDAKASNMKVDMTMWQAAVPLLVAAGFRNPLPIGQRELSITFTASNKMVDCPACDHVHDAQNWWIMQNDDGSFNVKSYSTRCRILHLQAEVQPIITASTLVNHTAVKSSYMGLCEHLDLMGFKQPPCQDDCDDTCMIVRQHLETCPSCSAKHVGDKWVVKTMVESCYTLENAGGNCQERLIWFCGPNQEIQITNPHLFNIYQHPKATAGFVELYVQEHKGIIMSDASQKLYMFDGVRWVPKLDQEMANSMQKWLSTLFNKFFDLFAREDKFGNNPKRLDDIRRRLRQANGYVQTEVAVSHFLKNLKRLVVRPDLHDVMDANPFLLGTSNGILDLQTGELRQGHPDDMVSKSVGYAIPETRDAHMMQQVEEMMAALYPIKDERQTAQLWSGYCLQGRHPMKRFALLTDAGGSRAGNNGKTTFAKALYAAMGPEYASKGKNELLYKTDSNNETVNSHGAGILQYRGVRMAFFEELDPKRQLADGKQCCYLLSLCATLCCHLPACTQHMSVCRLAQRHQWRRC